MAAWEVLSLNTTVPQIMAPQAGDTYSFPRVAEFLLGTAAAPAITFSGDTNTGIFSPGADQVAIATGGVTRATVDSTGLLTVPAGVETTSFFRATKTGSDTIASGPFFFLRNEGTGSAARGWVQQLSAADNLDIWNFNGVTWERRLTLTLAGNLGLGFSITEGYWGSQAATPARQVITYSASSTSINTTGKGLVIANSDLTAGNLSSLVFGTWNTDATPIAVASVYSINTDVRVNSFTTGALGFATVASGGVLTERMRLDAAGNLGLGATPSSKLTVQGDTGITVFNTVASSQASIYFQDPNLFRVGAYNATGAALGFFTTPSGGGQVERMRLDAAGNLGIGLIPSTWAALYKAVTLSYAASLYGFWDGTNTLVGLANGCHMNASYVWEYTVSSQPVNRFSSWVDGEFFWDRAPSGTAGTTVSFTRLMTLDGSGNLGVGTTTFGTSAAKVISIGTGTEPSTGPADTVQFFSVDRSAGNTIPGIRCEGTGVTDAAITNVTVTNKIAMKVNGTIYYLLATTSAA